MAELSEKEYWDNTYAAEHGESIDIAGFRNFSDRKIYEALTQIDLAGKRVLEIGAGDSQWLPFLAKQFPSSQFAGLDYSEIGCDRLRAKADRLGLDIEVIQGDLFKPPQTCLNQFDVVISFGVVEHFDRLGDVLSALKLFLKSEGEVFSVIPNLAGFQGRLVKRLNADVYEIHNPHDIKSFLDGHQQAELQVRHSGYVCSNNFTALSSCIDMTSDDPRGRWKRFAFRWLSRLTTASWLFESKLFELPKTSLLSPYIYCVAKSGD